MGDDAVGGEPDGGGHSAFLGDAPSVAVATASYVEHVLALPPPASVVRGEVVLTLPPSR
jgi:hypothetical protein